MISEPQSLFLVGIFLVVLGLTKSFVVRRGSLHIPPGPTGLPFVGNLYQIPKREPWVFFENLSKNFGEIFSLDILGHTIIVVNSLEAVDTLFVKRSPKYANKPVREMAQLTGLAATIPFMDTGSLFNQARKQFNLDIGSRPLSKYYGDLEDASLRLIEDLATDLRCERLEEHIDSVLRAAVLFKVGDWAAITTHYASNVLTTHGLLFLKIAVGYNGLRHGDDPVSSRIRQLATFAAKTLGGTYSSLDRLPFLRFLPRWVPGSRLMRLAHRWRTELAQTANITLELAQEGMAGGSTNSFMANVLSKMPEAVQKGEEDQLKLIAITMTAGGMVPLQSTTLTLLLAMARYPDIQKRAQEELDSVLGGRRPTMADRVALPYMNALILEVLRWIPVGTLISRRVLEDDEYGGFLIPKGATILANNWAITRDPKVYESPGEFRPERFFHPTSSSAIALEKPPMLTPYYFAFGYGRRVCPGQYLAEAVLFMNAAQILSTFDISCGPSSSSCLEDDIRMVNKGAACRVEHVNCVLALRSAAKSEQRPI